MVWGVNGFNGLLALQLVECCPTIAGYATCSKFSSKTMQSSTTNTRHSKQLFSESNNFKLSNHPPCTPGLLTVEISGESWQIELIKIAVNLRPNNVFAMLCSILWGQSPIGLQKRLVKSML